MSIIQDALRRKEEEHGGARPEPATAPREGPPPRREPARVPSAPPTPRTDPSHRRSARAAWAAGLLLAVGIIVWGYREIGFRVPPTAHPNPPAPAMTGHLPLPAPIALRSSEPAAADSMSSPSPAASAQTPEALPAPPSAGAATTVSAGSPSDPGWSSDGRPEVPPAGSSRWPAFKVTGVVTPAGSRRGTVFIGDEMIDVGRSSRQGIRVIGIQGEDATLEFRGERRSYRVGDGEI